MLDKQIDMLINTLTEIKSLDEQKFQELSLDDMVNTQSLIKRAQKEISEFQHDLSPIRKRVNRKRINELKKKGPNKDSISKAELIELVESYRKELDQFRSKERE